VHGCGRDEQYLDATRFARQCLEKRESMTYEQVAELFRKHEKASTWPTGKNAQRFFFWVRGRAGHKTCYLGKDDGQARYLWVPIEEVIDHVEPTGNTDSENIYYRLKKV